jgi:hypothetical protein
VEDLHQRPQTRWKNVIGCFSGRSWFEAGQELESGLRVDLVAEVEARVGPARRDEGMKRRIAGASRTSWASGRRPNMHGSPRG